MILKLQIINGKNPIKSPIQNNLFLIIFFCIMKGEIARNGTQVKNVLNINAIPIQAQQKK